MELNHPVFGDIELDSLKCKHLRTKLKDFRPADSTPRLREFLSAIDFYLKGVSASDFHAEIVDKLAGQRERLRIDDLKGLARERNPDDRFKGLHGGRPMRDVIFSDPMR